MGNKYDQISLEEREKLYALKLQRKSFRDIAKELGRDHRTWSREWKKNRHNHSFEYLPCKAHLKAEKRKKEQRTKAPLKCPEIFLYVREALRDKLWSPESISLRIGIDKPGLSITPEAIYQYVYGKGKSYKLWQYLPNAHRRRRKWHSRHYRASKIDGRSFIENRPSEIEARKETGHWEVDLMEGTRKSEGVVQALVERKTRYLIATKLKSKHTEPAIKAISKAINQHPVLTITSDNGTENSAHKLLTVPWYFTHPYHSWEKGTVENTIGRLRRFFPKGTDLTQVTQADLDRATEMMNDTPRKCHGGLKPKEVYQRECAKLNHSPKWGTST